MLIKQLSRRLCIGVFNKVLGLIVLYWYERCHDFLRDFLITDIFMPFDAGTDASLALAKPRTPSWPNSAKSTNFPLSLRWSIPEIQAIHFRFM
jgi:hypothetical protein